MSNQSRAYRKERHIHKFIRVRDDRIALWRCAHRYCNYTLYPKQELFLVGQATTCWSCDNEFAMSAESLQTDLPVCPTCRMTEEDQAIAALLEQETNEINKST